MSDVEEEAGEEQVPEVKLTEVDVAEGLSLLSLVKVVFLPEPEEPAPEKKEEKEGGENQEGAGEGEGEGGAEGENDAGGGDGAEGEGGEGGGEGEGAGGEEEKKEGEGGDGENTPAEGEGGEGDVAEGGEGEAGEGEGEGGEGGEGEEAKEEEEKEVRCIKYYDTKEFASEPKILTVGEHDGGEGGFGIVMSVEVPQGMRVVFYELPEFMGGAFPVTANVENAFELESGFCKEGVGSIRVEDFGDREPPVALGMSSGDIAAWRITASSVDDRDEVPTPEDMPPEVYDRGSNVPDPPHPPRPGIARLDSFRAWTSNPDAGKEEGEGESGGEKEENEEGEAAEEDDWLQVMLREPTMLFGLATQGHPSRNQWVESYTVSVSSDGESWTAVKPKPPAPQLDPDESERTPTGDSPPAEGEEEQEEDNEAAEFEGNSDSWTIVHHYFSEPVEAQYVRVYPVDVYGATSMRLELYGTPPPPIGATAFKAQNYAVDGEEETPSSVFLPGRYTTDQLGDFASAASLQLPAGIKVTLLESEEEDSRIVELDESVPNLSALEGEGRDTYWGGPIGIMVVEDLRDVQPEVEEPDIEGSYAQAFVNLKVSEKEITNVSVLERRPYLQNVDLSQNSISDCKSFGKMQSLVKLNLSQNRVVEPLAFDPVESLEEVDLSQNRIREMSTNFCQPRLCRLNVNQNKITEVNLDDAMLPNLVRLEMRGNALKVLTGLSLSSLTELFLAQNTLDTMDSVNLPNLRVLHLRENQFSNLDGFLFPKVEVLNLRDNVIETFDEIRKLNRLPCLKTLALAGNPCMELDNARVEAVEALPKISKLDKQEVSAQDRKDMAANVEAKAALAAEQREAEEAAKREAAEEAEAEGEGEE